MSQQIILSATNGGTVAADSEHIEVSFVFGRQLEVPAAKLLLSDTPHIQLLAHSPESAATTSGRPASRQHQDTNTRQVTWQRDHAESEPEATETFPCRASAADHDGCSSHSRLCSAQRPINVP